MFSTADFSEYEKLWTNSENLLTPNELQDALGNAFVLFFETNPGRIANSEIFLNLLLQKTEKFMSNSQIFEMFWAKNILHEAHSLNLSFEVLWNFLSNHTNEKERKEILLKDDLDDKNFYFSRPYKELKERYSSYIYWYYHYDFTPFKIFHRALIKRKTYTFDFTKEIYQEYLNKSEIQEIILNSFDFLYYVIGNEDEEYFKEFASILKKFFEGNEKKLKRFLESKNELINLSVFELIEDFQGLSHSRHKWFNNCETLYDLIK